MLRNGQIFFENLGVFFNIMYERVKEREVCLGKHLMKFFVKISLTIFIKVYIVDV